MNRDGDVYARPARPISHFLFPEQTHDRRRQRYLFRAGEVAGCRSAALWLIPPGDTTMALRTSTRGLPEGRTSADCTRAPASAAGACALQSTAPSLHFTSSEPGKPAKKHTNVQSRTVKQQEGDFIATIRPAIPWHGVTISAAGTERTFTPFPSATPPAGTSFPAIQFRHSTALAPSSASACR